MLAPNSLREEQGIRPYLTGKLQDDNSEGATCEQGWQGRLIQTAYLSTVSRTTLKSPTTQHDGG